MFIMGIMGICIGMRGTRQAALLESPSYVTIIMFNLKETDSLPLGPQMTQEQHFAPGRCGFTTYGMFVWGLTIPLGIWFCVCTRILEKGTPLAVALKQFVLQRLKDLGYLTTWMTFKLHSDNGPHFRSNRGLGACAMVYTEMFVIHWLQAFGLACHMKDICDEKFGLFRGVIKKAMAQQWLREIGDVVAALKLEYAKRLIIYGSELQGPEEYHDWMPPMAKAALRCPRIDPKCIPPINRCYRWSFRRTDKRGGVMGEDFLFFPSFSL